TFVGHLSVDPAAHRALARGRTRCGLESKPGANAYVIEKTNAVGAGRPASMATLANLVIVARNSAVLEFALANPQCPDPALERGRRDPELRRRARRPGDAAPAFGECRLDDLSLGAWLLWEGRRRGDSWRPPARISGKPRWLDGKHATGAQDHGSLDDVLQLADVPRPIVGLQQVERLLVDGPERLAGLSAVALNEVFDQHQDVF